MKTVILKQLKKSGFPFKEHDDDYINKIYGGLPYYATLSELIDACGNDFYSLEKLSDGWKAYQTQDSLEECDIECCGFRIGKTPEEAVALLWLKLHETKKTD